ncbi:hypothetical protein Emed_003081 [Eimeria media]
MTIASWLYKQAVWRFALEFALAHIGGEKEEEKEVLSDLQSNKNHLYENAWRSCVERNVQLVQQAGIEPLFVFDGAPLKAKEETNRRRREDAAVAAAAAAHEQREGRESNALLIARRSCCVPTAFKLYVQWKLRSLGLVFFVAPYEADAQIAKLVLDGLATAALTEDSDLLPYGCNQVLSKLQHDGGVVLTDLQELLSCLSRSSGRVWTLEALQVACCLSGCDYHSQGVAGVGFMKAERLLARYGPDVKAIFHALKEGGRPVTAEVPEKVRVALLTFRHQTVFSIRGKGEIIKAVPLTPPPVPLDGPSQQMLGKGQKTFPLYIHLTQARCCLTSWQLEYVEVFCILYIFLLFRFSLFLPKTKPQHFTSPATLRKEPVLGPLLQPEKMLILMEEKGRHARGGV